MALRARKVSGALEKRTPGQVNWPKSVFPQTKATYFETMMTTVYEVNRDKTKVPDELIFRSVLLDCCTAELDE